MTEYRVDIRNDHGLGRSYWVTLENAVFSSLPEARNHVDSLGPGYSIRIVKEEVVDFIRSEVMHSPTLGINSTRLH